MYCEIKRIWLILACMMFVFSLLCAGCGMTPHFQKHSDGKYYGYYSDRISSGRFRIDFEGWKSEGDFPTGVVMRVEYFYPDNKTKIFPDDIKEMYISADECYDLFWFFRTWTMGTFHWYSDFKKRDVRISFFTYGENADEINAFFHKHRVVKLRKEWFW